MVLSRNGKNKENGSFNWGDALVDAGIMAMITFFTSLGGMSAVGVSSPVNVVAAGIAACTQFFTVLGMKRGLVKK